MSTAYIGLGSNLGEPIQQLNQAISALKTMAQCHLIAVSSLYRSTPLNNMAQPDYVNAVAQLETTFTPLNLLRALQQLETQQGRERHYHFAPRTLDLDLLAHGLEIVDDAPDLILPHPRLHQRAFVLLPLCELAPGWRHPLLGRTAVELLGSLPADVAAEILPSFEQPD